MELQEIINIDAAVMSGTPVFNGTRVPIQSLFWHIEEGISIDDFLDDFPSVSRQQIDALLRINQQFLLWVFFVIQKESLFCLLLKR